VRDVVRGYGDEDSKAVEAYVKYFVVANLRKSIPGLHMYLSGVAYSKYGMSLEDLIWKKPKVFVELLLDYFRAKEVVASILEVLFKELTSAPGGREALEKLLDGDEEAFRSLAIKVLREEAKKWVKNLTV
jgi:hypothetical protein